MNVIITGASSGIGFSLVQKFASLEGVNVFAIARREEKLKELNEVCREKFSKSISILKFDLSSKDYSSLDQFLNENHFDVLINNAGHLTNLKFEELEDKDWEDAFKVNVIGPAKLIRALLPRMGGEKHTHIINIGSMGGFQGSSKFPGLTAYSASKAAIHNLTETLSEEFKDRNISVNCLALGAVQTEMLSAAFPGYTAPLNAEEMSEYIKWFAINGFKFHKGKIIPVSVSIP